MKSTCILLASAFVVAPTVAFVAPKSTTTNNNNVQLSAQKSRIEFLRDIATVGIATATVGVGGVTLPAFADETLPSGVAIKVTKSA